METEELLEELISRWKQAFDDIESLPFYKAQVQTFQYSDGLRYSLNKFEWNGFPSDGATTTDKTSIDPMSLYEYGINKDGQPCYVNFGYSEKASLGWQGFYTYSSSFVEYVEFCMETRVPSALHRIKYEDGNKASSQSLLINGRGGGSPYLKMTKEEMIQSMLSNDHSVISTVTKYYYDADNKIERATNIGITPGIGKHTFYDEYCYDEHKNLDSIRTFYEQGHNALTYCRAPGNMEEQLLIEKLAEDMAGAIREALIKENIKDTISLMELSYKYADPYIPAVVWLSTDEVAERLGDEESDFLMDYDRSVYPDVRSFERSFAQLEQIIEEKDDEELGVLMLKKTACLLNRSSLWGVVKISDDFAVYAIDWSTEGNNAAELQETLLECGIADANIQSWREKGIF